MKDKLKLSIFWIFSFLVIIFMMTFISHAEGLPYIVSNENIENFDTFNSILINNKGLNMNNLPDYSFGYPIFEGGRRNFVLYIPNTTPSYEFTLTSSDYQSFDLESDRAQLHLITSYRRLQWHIEYVQYGDPRFYGSDGSVADVYINFFDGTSDGYGNELTPKYSMTNYLYDDNQYQVVFGFGNPVPPYTGHATAPEEFESPVYPTGHAKPDQVPSAPTINNYTWTIHNNPPIDTTNLESLIESLINIVIYNFSYLFTNLAGLFSNFISNVGDFIAYIGQLIEYYGNLIISNIQNAITTFYNNMVSLFDPVLDGISYLIEPLDQEAAYDTFALTSFNSDFTAIQTNFNSFFGQFSNISEPSSYKIPIHFENISMFSDVGVQYLDLGWLDSVKTPLRAFLWCITTYGLIAGIFDAIPNYINGGGGEDD